MLFISVTVIGTSSAQADLQRIRFETGATSAQITDTVTLSEVNRYVFRAFEGQSIFVNAGQVVTLNMYSPDGVLLFTTTSDAYQSLILNQTGDYIIHITRADPSVTVSYTLDLQIYGAIGLEREPVERIQFASGAISASLVDTLPPNQVQQYVFWAFSGQTLTLTEQGATFYIIAPDESVLALNPDQAQNVVLPLTGDYRITVYDPTYSNTFVNFTLTLTIIGETTGVALPERIQFASGAISASVFGIVSGVESDEYVFNAGAGQNMTLAVTQGTMTLVSPSGIPLVRGDVLSDIQNINLILPESGDYRVRVFRRADQPAVEYRLDLTIIN